MRESARLVAVLAGGAGTRLGASKPLVALAGRPLISHTLAAAYASGLEVIVVAKRGLVLPELRGEVVYEPAHPRHPVCGLLAALGYAERHCAGAGVVAVACDMPFLTGQLLAWLARVAPDQADRPAGDGGGGSHVHEARRGPSRSPSATYAARPVLACVGGRLQPLLGRYAPSDTPVLARALDAECSLREAALRLDPAVAGEAELGRFGDPQRLCFNVNTPEDLRAAEQLFAEQLAGGGSDARRALQ